MKHTLEVYSIFVWYAGLSFSLSAKDILPKGDPFSAFHFLGNKTFYIDFTFSVPIKWVNTLGQYIDFAPEISHIHVTAK